MGRVLNTFLNEFILQLKYQIILPKYHVSRNKLQAGASLRLTAALTDYEHKHRTQVERNIRFI